MSAKTRTKTAPKPKTTRKRLPLAERQRLVLDAVAHTLAQVDGEELTVNGIARTLGWSVPAVTRCYQYRADMVQALLDFAETSLDTLYQQLKAHHGDDGLGFALAYVQVLAQFTDTNPSFIRLFTNRVFLGAEPAIGERVRRLHTHWERQLREALKVAILHERESVSFDATSTATILFHTVLARWQRQALGEAGLSPVQEQALWHAVLGIGRDGLKKRSK